MSAIENSLVDRLCWNMSEKYRELQFNKEKCFSMFLCVSVYTRDLLFDCLSVHVCV